MLPEGRLKGLTVEELSLQRVHEDVGIGGGHLGAHCRSLYLLVDVCVERENIALENYVKECLHNISGQWEKIPVKVEGGDETSMVAKMQF